MQTALFLKLNLSSLKKNANKHRSSLPCALKFMYTFFFVKSEWIALCGVKLIEKKDVMGKESFLCQHFWMDFTLYNSYSVTAWRKCMRVIFSHLVISIFKIWFQVMVFLLQQNFCKVHSFVNIMVSFYKTFLCERHMFINICKNV